MMVKKPLALAIALALSPCFAQADEVSDLKAQVEALQKQIDALKSKIEQVTTQVQSQKTEMQAQQAEQQKKNEQFLAKQPGATGLTFLTPGGGDVTLYGNLDVSFDYATKACSATTGTTGACPSARWDGNRRSRPICPT
jgi:TolA-binding protein